MPQSDAPPKPAEPLPSPLKRWGWRLVKWGLCFLVIWFVGKRAWELCREEDWSRIDFRIGWLIPAGLAYAVGWLPSVWYWRTMIHRVGGKVRFDAAARAYYCGHLGKYVPGKATVLVIRSAMLKDRGSPVSVSVLTATCETLMMMATGAALAVALLPWLIGSGQTLELPSWASWIMAAPWLPGLAVVAVCLTLSPIIASLLTLLAVKFTPDGMLEGESRVRFTPGLVISGLAAFVVSWMLHGLSLGFTLRSVGDSVNWASLPIWAGAVAGATAVGFAALFAPGGLGVREGLLLGVLSVQPDVTPGQAAVAPLLLRAVWFVTEISVAAVLYYFFRTKPTPQTPD